MRKFMSMLFGGIALGGMVFSGDAAADKSPVVVIDTNLGKMEVELNQEKAPKTVSNFLSYVDDKFYDGTIFHRVIKGFMIQGGGFTADMKQKPTKAPVANEASNGLKNAKGTIAMARTSDPNSATAQFFINDVNNSFLDYKDSSPQGIGYAVFGKVVSGEDVLEKIAAVKVKNQGMFENVPEAAVTIKSIRRKS